MSGDRNYQLGIAANSALETGGHLEEAADHLHSIDSKLGTGIGSSAPNAYGIDTAGADAYVTLVTVPAGGATHLHVVLMGSFDAILSCNSGTTDHFRIPAGSVHVFDSLTLTAGATIQGKNAVGGSSYTNLSVTCY